MPLTKRQREILTYLSAYSEQNGFAPSFVPLYMRSQELALELGTRKVKSEELCGLRVSLNPRFGAWDWSTVGIKTDQAQSDFLVSGPPLGSTECHFSG